MAASRYVTDSRAPRYSLLFALPLLLAYEGLAWFLSDPTAGGVRNGADVILKGLFAAAGGARGVLAFEVGLGLLGVWLIA